MRLLRLPIKTAVLAVALAGGACEPTPMSDAQTPYERYQVLRGRHRATEPDGAGPSKPNLRQRLAPLEQP